MKNPSKKTPEAYGKYVLLRPLKEEGPKSRLIVPKETQKKPEEGIVISVGSGVEGKVKKGDHVHFMRYMEQEVEVDGKTLFAIKEDNILTVWPK